MPLIIGHRGDAANYPENTISSFKSAYEKGADIIELDVQLSRDGYIMVCHDYSLNRTSNLKGLLSNYTLNELKNGDFGSWFSNEFKNEKIPTLAEVFKYFELFNLEFNIEIKSTRDNFGVIEEKLYSLIKKHDMTERVYISSFNHFSLQLMKKYEAKIRTGVLYTAKMINPEEYALNIGAYSLNPHYLTVEKEMMKSVKKVGVKVFPYTVDKENEMLHLIDIGVNGIITDDPAKLSSIKKRLQMEE